MGISGPPPSAKPVPQGTDYGRGQPSFVPDRERMFRDLWSRLWTELLIMGGLFGIILGSIAVTYASFSFRLFALLFPLALVACLAAPMLYSMYRLRKEAPMPVVLTPTEIAYDVPTISLRRGGRLKWDEVGQVTRTAQWFDSRLGLETVTVYHRVFRQNYAWKTVPVGAASLIRIPFLLEADAGRLQQAILQRVVENRTRPA